MVQVASGRRRERDVRVLDEAAALDPRKSSTIRKFLTAQANQTPRAMAKFKAKAMPESMISNSQSDCHVSVH